MRPHVLAAVAETDARARVREVIDPEGARETEVS